jgi:hypothetical protein
MDVKSVPFHQLVRQEFDILFHQQKVLQSDSQRRVLYNDQAWEILLYVRNRKQSSDKWRLLKLPLAFSFTLHSPCETLKLLGAVHLLYPISIRWLF